jgi:MerR family transcriptional regulator, light-induced transcriptional regulator
MYQVSEIESASNEPLYNIGVVSRMTGLSMATLRAWERRYEFPSSERTSGGHRLYSEKDVLRLQWVKARINDGMQTSQAIQALQHQEKDGHVLLLEKPVEQKQVKPSYSPLHLMEAKDRLLHSLLELDIQTAENVLNDVLVLNTPDDVILEVIGPTIAAIGAEWEKGNTNISTEHLATNFLRQRLLMWMLGGPPARQVPPIILACAPNEWHEGSLLVLGSLLRRRRWPIVYLGQAVPVDDLAEIIKDITPSLVILVAMMEEPALELIEWPKYMPEIAASNHPIIGYGGRAFSLNPELRLRMKGLYLGNSFKEGIETVERLL